MKWSNLTEKLICKNKLTFIMKINQRIQSFMINSSSEAKENLFQRDIGKPSEVSNLLKDHVERRRFRDVTDLFKESRSGAVVKARCFLSCSSGSGQAFELMRDEKRIKA